MKVAEASEPTIVQLKIRSKWLQNYKASDSDGASNYSAVHHPQPATICLHEMLCARLLLGSGLCDWNRMSVNHRYHLVHRPVVCCDVVNRVCE
jgi:hypothetical protein